jgi:hypothetical protein
MAATDFFGQAPEFVPESSITDVFEEVERTISQSEAKKEAERCLRCGLICYNRDIVEALGRAMEENK